MNNHLIKPRQARRVFPADLSLSPILLGWLAKIRLCLDVHGRRSVADLESWLGGDVESMIERLSDTQTPCLHVYDGPAANPGRFVHDPTFTRSGKGQGIDARARRKKISACPPCPCESCKIADSRIADSGGKIADSRPPATPGVRRGSDPPPTDRAAVLALYGLPDLAGLEPLYQCLICVLGPGRKQVAQALRLDRRRTLAFAAYADRLPIAGGRRSPPQKTRLFMGLLRRWRQGEAHEPADRDLDAARRMDYAIQREHTRPVAAAFSRRLADIISERSNHGPDRL